MPTRHADERQTRVWALRRAAGVLASSTAARLAEVTGRSATNVPRSTREITPSWLTGALCSGAPGARVVAVERTRASSGTTSRAALRVELNERGVAAGLPTRLFVKCTPGLAQRLMLGLGGIIEREVGFYRDVRPGLDVQAPAGYHAVLDRRTWRSVVVMEDVVATRGAEFWRASNRITRGQIESLLTEVAAWHGALWNSPRLAAWGWLQTPQEQMRRIDALLGLADRRSAGTRRARRVLPTALLGRRDDLHEGLRRSMTLASRGPATYLHGDLHVANTYRTADGQSGVADWQVGLRGGWTFDVAYLLLTALAVEDRRAWERDLLEFYLERLVAAGGERIPRQQAWDAYRQATFYPYFAWLYTIGRSRLQPSFQPDEISLTLIERIATAIDDLASLAAVGL